MNTRETALRNLSAAEFALWEIHLFLDVHPRDEKMIRAREKAAAKYEALRKEYVENYSPLTTREARGDEWLKGPWPWEYGGCDR